jgi:Ca2+-binding EF-hand superfamily protein
MFDRADKNKDVRITRDELLQPRRKAFAKLDKNRDGRLSLDEWA